jgi:hypothetical protein
VHPALISSFQRQRPDDKLDRFGLADLEGREATQCQRGLADICRVLSILHRDRPHRRAVAGANLKGEDDQLHCLLA